PALVPEPLLKIEKQNYLDQLLVGVECFAIAAKRYVLFRRDAKGQITIVKASEHGLGHLLDPRGPDEHKDATWFKEFWRLILCRAFGLEHAEPAWLDRPVVTRFAINSPYDLQLRHQIGGLRPFNFALVSHVAPFGHPASVDPTRFQLIRAFSRNPAEWLEGPWFDRYTAKRYCVSTDPAEARPDVVRLKTFRDVLEAYERHPEAKSLGPNGEPCGPLTAGLLQRRPIHATSLMLIGKEAHRLEEVTDGLIQDWSAVQQVYANPAQDPWLTTVMPMLQRLPKGRLARAVGVSPRAIQALRNGKAQPTAMHRAALVRIAGAGGPSGALTQGHLAGPGVEAPSASCRGAQPPVL
ncbi:MAG: hypothetical protein ACHP7H_09030, partial [Hyphomicrobiales bacterium]